MSRAELKQKANEQIKGNIWMLFLISLVMTIFVGAPTFIFHRFHLQVVGSLIELFMIGPISIGYYRVFLGLTKYEKPNFDTFFSGFNVFGKSLALILLVDIFTLLWTLLLFIPGIIKAYSYSQALYILAENPDKTPMQCIRESQEMMQGHKWELFVFELSFILWVLLTVITFGIAGIYTIPYIQAGYTNFYLSIKPSKTSEYVPPVLEY